MDKELKAYIDERWGLYEAAASKDTKLAQHQHDGFNQNYCSVYRCSWIHFGESLMSLDLNSQVLIAAVQVVQAWDNKEYLKEPIENLRTALKNLMELI